MSKTDWLSPLNRLIWIQAFRDRKTEVKLRDGRVFNVDYDKYPGYAHVTLKSGEYAPRGNFDLEKASHAEWIYKNPKPTPVASTSMTRLDESKQISA